MRTTSTDPGAGRSRATTTVGGGARLAADPDHPPSDGLLGTFRATVPGGLSPGMRIRNAADCPLPLPAARHRPRLEDGGRAPRPRLSCDGERSRRLGPPTPRAPGSSGGVIFAIRRSPPGDDSGVPRRRMGSGSWRTGGGWPSTRELRSCSERIGIVTSLDPRQETSMSSTNPASNPTAAVLRRGGPPGRDLRAGERRRHRRHREAPAASAARSCGT